MAAKQTLLCPHCGASVSLPAETCPRCGAVLGLAAAVAQADLLAHVPESAPPPPVATEALVPRLGETLVAKGWITHRQLEQALAYQQQQRQQGRDLRLGQALIELGYLDPETLDRAVAEQIWHLHQALERAKQELETQVHERTAQLRRALERVQELSRIKANFVARVSHELRTPLTHLVGYLDMMAQEQLGPLTEDQREAVEVMRRATNRLSQLIEDLIRFALLSRGELSLNIQPVAVDYICQQALEAIWAKAYAKGIHLSQECPDTPLLVQADGEKISWALHHLLDNAVKFTPAGGTVRLSVTHDTAAEAVRFSVEDTGPGIPQERLHEIFEPFQQLEEAATRTHSGLGLGLALVRQILDAHGVELQIETQPGRGSRFWFTLPLLPRQAPV